MAHEGEWFYLYSTGTGIATWRSKDLAGWERDGAVFDQPPAWTVADFPKGNYLWAPDVTYFGGRFHLYYAVSHFGKNDSALGHAVNDTLDRGDARFRWIDRGAMLRTHEGDHWNAIDPAVFIDDRQTPWMVAGSFWSGIKLFELNPQTGEAVKPDPIAIASRPPPDAIEAGFVAHHGEWYYLFVSFDYCCRGVRSTYKLMVGRSHQITGPYADFEKRPMLEGGGTVVLASHGTVRGPGHAGLFNDGHRDLLVHHFYDANDDGRSKLQIRPIIWNTDGWPLAGEPIGEGRSQSATQPTLAGSWDCSISFGDPFRVKFRDDGSTSPNMGHWSVDGDRLTLALAARGAARRYTTEFFVESNGTVLIGRDQDGAVLRLTRIATASTQP